jgi:hypothetical protein
MKSTLVLLVLLTLLIALPFQTFAQAAHSAQGLDFDKSSYKVRDNISVLLENVGAIQKDLNNSLNRGNVI